ncbi:UNVERIFIED_ORG: hypothetical protein B2H98_01270 [Clostridium botulinum]|uniref:hypothetical protein n=1 Tax=Clostridium botulinum TaxID=1491 RepID=UPI0007736314|nr:hypothetical protein [Clostridium botulinum]
MRLDKKYSLSEVAKNLKDLSIKTLPTFLGLIPEVGIILQTGAEIVIGCSDIIDEKKKEESQEKQFIELKQAIEENKIDEESVITQIKQSLLLQLRDELVRKSVYVFGVCLYTLNGSEYSNAEKECITKVLSCNYTWEGEYQSFADEIQAFLEYYCGSGPLVSNDDYFVMDDGISINFFTDYDRCVRDDSKVCKFIDLLNEFLEGTLITEYAFF